MASSRSNVAANSSIDCVEELEAYLKASSVEHEIKEMMKAMFEVSTKADSGLSGPLALTLCLFDRPSHPTLSLG